MDLRSLHPDDLTLLDACAGFGMLGESVHLALESLGIGCRTLVAIERDSAAAAAYMARMGKTPLSAPAVADCLESALEQKN